PRTWGSPWPARWARSSSISATAPTSRSAACSTTRPTAASWPTSWPTACGCCSDWPTCAVSTSPPPCARRSTWPPSSIPSSRRSGGRTSTRATWHLRPDRGTTPERPQLMGLDGRVIMVTGGARGIGRAVALRLARDGADLALADIEPEGLAAVAAEARGLGRRCLPALVDVTREDQVRAIAEGAGRDLGAIDVLVNNAAIIGPTTPVAQVPRADWDDVLAVNLTGPLLCCQAVLPGMIAPPSRH